MNLYTLVFVFNVTTLITTRFSKENNIEMIACKLPVSGKWLEGRNKVQVIVHQVESIQLQLAAGGMRIVLISLPT